MKRTRSIITSSALAALAVLLPCSLLAAPIVVRIDDSAFGPPVIEVLGAPNGYNVYVGPLVDNLAVEDGALIDLFGIDTWGLIPNMGWRFIDPKAPNPAQAAADIVWIDHDDCYTGPFYCSGDLQVGFNSHHPGGWYNTPPPNPPPGADVNAGPVKPYWVTVYSSSVLVVEFKGPVIPGH